ncbi:MAG TPA: endonuclease/exonuclease/phosphatase family protein [Pyrinomonadaceae bacterium]|nr:endonuclease/exonuclease/phosphatase family protein [Pyrinomonadaceae bacterium]
MMNRIYKNRGAEIFLFLLLACLPYTPASAREHSAASFFTYAELTALYERETLSQPVEAKLNRLLTIPFVDNSTAGAESPRFSQSARLGDFMRVAHWNIERGLEFDAIEAVFGSEERFAAILNENEFPAGSDERRRALEQAAMLRAADVIVLNEVDFGMKRTEYRNVAADLAARLKMNYAFGVQFVELSPVRLSQELKGASAEEKEIAEVIKVDPLRYKGLHGVAILSRFPLENVRLVPFKNQPYDWYKSEKTGASMLEKGKRKIAGKIFLEETLREVRRGGRATLLADISHARFPSGRVTIAATHLENRTKSMNRVKQLRELLDTVKDIRHPVVVAGDMNTSSSDFTPTSLRRELVKRFGSPQYWIRKSIGYALGFGLIEDTVLDGLTFWRKQSDPTVRHIPFLMPNSEHKFFSTLEDFRFSDGGAFDFRGDEERSHDNKNKPLANSNERGGKGFVNTYLVKRPINFIGKYKLDWIFVKPADLKKPDDKKGSYRFAPHFGRTFAEVNEIVEDRISDHRPMIVDLPLDEPLFNQKR